MVIWCLLEETEKPIIDDSWKLRVLKEGYFVDKFYLFVILLGAVSPHGNIHEEGPEVRLGNLIEKFTVLSLVEIFDQDYFLVPTTWRICVSLLRWVASRRRPHADERACLARHGLRLSQRCQISCFVRWTRHCRIDPRDLIAMGVGLSGLSLSLSTWLLAGRVICLHSLIFYFKMI